MEITQYLQALSEKHDNWPEEALERLLQLGTQGATENEEYEILHSWALNAIYESVGFRQKWEAILKFHNQ